MSELVREAEWSDAFFNFDDVSDAADSYFACGGVDMDIMRHGAASFLRLHPHCPFDAKWLIEDFIRRV